MSGAVSDDFDPDVVAGKQQAQVLGIRGEHNHGRWQGERGGGHHRVDRQIAMLAPRPYRRTP